LRSSTKTLDSNKPDAKEATKKQGEQTGQNQVINRILAGATAQIRAKKTTK
jgi:hypothetical protein